MKPAVKRKNRLPQFLPLIFKGGGKVGEGSENHPTRALPFKKARGGKRQGIVYLAGAGPGDPGLLTLRAAEVLADADVIVYDRLVNPTLLERASSARKIYVGKNIHLKGSNGTAYVGQDQTNRLLVNLARQGKRVVRLKGGDPFIFGRGAEEASYLKANGIPFEVVPGVSAGYAVPAYAGIPLTDRRLASLVTFVTAHGKDKGTDIDWNRLAKVGGTLVFFMGVKNLPLIVERLVQNGKSSTTPASVIEWGTWPRQRVVEGTLADIVKRTKEAKIESPALSVIGQVNKLRKELKWFPSPYPLPEGEGKGEGGKFLSGKKVLVTRAAAQAGSLKEALEKEGAEVLEYPAIEILPPRSWTGLDKALKKISRFHWVVFTSANAVRSVFSRLQRQGKDARIFSGLRIAAIGEVTCKALLENGLRPDLMPEKFTSEALIEKFESLENIKGRHFLLPRTDIAPEALPQGLKKSGARVTQVEAYRTAPASQRAREKEEIKKRLRRREIDFVTFTSASTVKNFFDSFPKRERRRLRSKWVSIGPVTSQTLKEYGRVPFKEAREHTVRGLVEALANGCSR